MANILYANNAAGTLSAAITNVATSLTLNAGQGAAFPSPTAPQVFYATLTDAATQSLIEIVQVTAVSGDQFSIVRAQDGTSALSWNAGDIVSLRAIRLEFNGFENAAEGNFAAQNVSITPSTTLGIVGTITGNNANAGRVGEFAIVLGSATIVSATPNNTASLLLSAGDWDVQGTVTTNPAGGAIPSYRACGLSLTSATFGPSNNGQSNGYAYTSSSSTAEVITTPVFRVNVSTATTIFLVTQVNYTPGTMSTLGFIRARRVR